MKNIWRINMKTDGANKENGGQEGLLKFCQKENIVGIGWSQMYPQFIEGYNGDKNNTENIKNYIWNKIKKDSGKTRGFSTASNIIVDRMNIGDYIWTREGGNYWIAKVISESKYMFNNQDYKNYDIGFYRNVEYSRRSFTVSEVPGKVIACFSARNSTQCISDDQKLLFEYTDSLFNNKINSKINVDNWSNFFSANDIEEIIGLYLQKIKNLYVYTSTNKKSTSQIEFELVDDKGNKYGVQVKSGNVCINGKDYKEISKNMKIYLFASNNEVKNVEDNQNLIHIKVDEITTFIKENINILPDRIKNWIK